MQGDAGELLPLGRAKAILERAITQDYDVALPPQEARDLLRLAVEQLRLNLTSHQSAEASLVFDALSRASELYLVCAVGDSEVHGG